LLTLNAGRISEIDDPTTGRHTLEAAARWLGVPRRDVSPGCRMERKVGAKEVQDYFAAMGSPGASTYTSKAPHPYMQKTRTLDFCWSLDGEITLVLDTQEVHLRPVTRSCSAAPTTPVRTARAGRAHRVFRRTMGLPRGVPSSSLAE
jgi:hypothetical protein